MDGQCDCQKLIGNAMDRIGKPELARKHEKVFLIWNSGKLYFTFTRPGQLQVSYKKDIEESEDTKGAIRIRISKKNRQHNGQNKKDKNRSTEHTYKTKDRVTRTPLKTGGELR